MSKTEIKKELIASFSSDLVKDNDLKVAEDLVNNVLFDKYEEKAHCQILTGINVTDFRTLVSRLSARFKLSKEVEESILDSEYALQNDKVVREFTFRLAETGEVKYGRVATIRRGCNIDLAYSLYFVNFKFTAKKMDDKFYDKIRFLKDSAMSIVRPDSTEFNLLRKERNITTIEKEHFLTYFRHKALMLFKEEYPLVDLINENDNFSEENGQRNCTIL